MIELKQLCKKYKNTVILDNINLNITKGGIYGLVGENGAGKTTIIKLLAGLINKTSGRMIFCNQEDNIFLQEFRKKMSFIIETPCYYPDMNAYENMWVHFLIRNLKEEKKIAEILEFVGLSDSKKKVKNFSLGMKQRLAIATALLNDVEIMILDEPLNGLDPKGIIELRNLIKMLNDEMGITFIISSHMLNELQKVATDYIFIKNGRIIKEIKARQLDELWKSSYILSVSNVRLAQSIFNEGKIGYKVIDNKIYIDTQEDIKKISQQLCDKKICIYELYRSQTDMEDYYLKLMKQ